MTIPEPPPDPSPVRVQNEEPIAVEVMQDEPLRVRTEQDKVAATRTTSTERALAGAKVEADVVQAVASVEAEKLRTDDQRKISGIWERTQQIIALSVVETALMVIAVVILAPSIQSMSGDEVPQFALTASIAGMLFLTGVANLVIGFYFGRTNHTRVGGAATRDEADRGR